MQIIDGKLVAQIIRSEVKTEVENFAKQDKAIGLAVVLIGEDPASQVYVRNKINACKEACIISYKYNLDKDVTESEVLELINKLNSDVNVNGIMVQLPMPKHINEAAILNSINPSKDVDGCHYEQKGKLWTGHSELIACTPYGVMKLLEYYNIPIKGKHAVILGRSNLVGKPLSQLLLDKDATVTICHSKTQNLGGITSQADILCVAIGKANIVTADMVKNGAVVIDIGINRVDGKLYGDVDYENVKDKCSYITPVPGGVGPMTVTMLMANTVKAFKIQNGIK